MSDFDFNDAVRRTIAEQHDRIEALEHENAKLHQQLADVTESMGRVEERCAKLRKLCSDTWTYITEPVSKRNNLKERLARLDDIADRMRELGVDV